MVGLELICVNITLAPNSNYIHAISSLAYSFSRRTYHTPHMRQSPGVFLDQFIYGKPEFGSPDGYRVQTSYRQQQSCQSQQIQYQQSAQHQVQYQAQTVQAGKIRYSETCL